ncbi:MAG: 30S ribosomal protein S19e [Candidatus Thermoplasmatota archaeon]|nr:30S ribosomal protein S19e [Candidatus Thermoplasmatota archaeon]
MTNVYDVPAKEFIDEIAKQLEKQDAISLPESNFYSKTSVARENEPEPDNWWYLRCASLLRKIYMNKTIGTQKLRSAYGGRLNLGSKPSKARTGSGSITRRAIQQLESAGYVKKIKGKGRSMTPKGRQFLDNIAHDVLNQVKKSYPGLEKY